MEVIRVSGRLAKLSVDRLGNAEFESSLCRWLQEGKFLAIGDVLFGLCENSTETKDRNGKRYLSSVIYPEFGDGWSCWSEFTAVFRQRIGSTASLEYPTLGKDI